MKNYHEDSDSNLNFQHKNKQLSPKSKLRRIKETMRREKN